MDRKFSLVKSSIPILALLLALGAAMPASAQEGQTDYTIQVVQVDTSQFPKVDVWVSVTDAEGNPLTSVPGDAFTLTENGQTIEISDVYQAGEQGPVTTVLAMDRSGSMNDLDKLAEAKAAAVAFVDLMRPEDATGVVAFNTQVETVHPITSDQAALRDAIAGVDALDDTAMYDALADSVGLLEGVQGRRAIIILSDGLDNRSQRTADDILGSVEQAQVSVYTIGLGDPSAGTGSTAGIDEAALQAIAKRSHGLYMYAPQPENLSDLYQQLSSRLQNEYRLTYVSPNTLHDGIERGVEVHLSEASAVAQTDYNPGGVIPETARSLSWPIFGALLAGLIFLLAAPDLLRLAKETGQAGPLKRQKSRVKLTGSDPAAMKRAKTQASPPRIRLRD